MRSNRHGKLKFGIVCVLMAAGLGPTAGCETQDLEAVVAGLEVVLDQLQQQQAPDDHNNDITFGEWLLSEIAD